MKTGLKEAIAALREELSESILAGADEDLQFEVGEITIEFQVEVSQSQEASGKVNIWVVDVGAGGKQASTQSHKITIPLKPTAKHGGPVLTGSDVIPG